MAAAGIAPDAPHYYTTFVLLQYVPHTSTDVKTRAPLLAKLICQFIGCIIHTCLYPYSSYNNLKCTIFQYERLRDALTLSMQNSCISLEFVGAMNKTDKMYEIPKQSPGDHLTLFYGTVFMWFRIKYISLSFSVCYTEKLVA